MAVARANSNSTGVQSSGSVASATGQAVTFPNSVSSGNLIVVAVVVNGNSTPNVSSVTDSAGNTYTQQITKADTGDHNRVEVWTAKATTGGTITVTVKADISAFISLGIIELSGADTTSPLDSSASSGPTTNASPTTGSITVGASGEMIVAVMTHANGTQSITENASYSDIYTNTNAANMPISAEYHAVSASEAATWTVGASVKWITAGISIKATTQTDATISPSLISAAFSGPSGNSEISPTGAVLSAAFSQRVPGLELDATPAVMTAAFSEPVPVASTGNTTSPSLISYASAQPSPGIELDATPSVLSAALSQLGPTPSSTTFPSLLGAAFSEPAPTVTTGGNATATAIVLTGVLSQRSPAPEIDTTPGLVSAVFTTIVPASVVFPTISALSAAFSALAPAVQFGSTLLISNVTAAFSVQAASIGSIEPIVFLFLNTVVDLDIGDLTDASLAVLAELGLALLDLSFRWLVRPRLDFNVKLDSWASFHLTAVPRFSLATGFTDPE